MDRNELSNLNQVSTDNMTSNEAKRSVENLRQVKWRDKREDSFTTIKSGTKSALSQVSQSERSAKHKRSVS